MAMWPSIMNASLLNGLRSQAHLPPQTWYYVAAVTLSTLNRPHEIPSVLRSALEHAANAPSQHPGDMTSLPGHTTHDRKLFVARRIREGLVKSTAVVGLPKTINALLELKRHTPDELVDQPMAASPTARAVELASVDSNALLHRGETFFSQVYGKIAARVMGQMDRSGTEDLGLTARLFYGYLLSNVTVLDPVETSWVLLAGLIPQDVSCEKAFCPAQILL